MAISTNGTIITRLAGALYNEYLSNASYLELKDTAAATVAANMLTNDFAGKTDAQLATTILTNLGLTSITGLNNWVAAQLTAAGSTAAAKGAKLVSMLNDYAMMTADATYGSYATSFNAKTEASLVKSQTTGTKSGSFATADTATNASLLLTSGVDLTVVGGAGSDTYTSVNTSTSQTLNAGDSLDGGAGTDTLNITSTAPLNLGTGVTAVGVENISLSASGGALTLDTAAMTGVTGVTNSGSTSSVSVSGLKALVPVTVVAASADTTVGFATAVTSGTADAITVNVNGVNTTGAGAVAVNADGFETVNVASSGSASGATTNSGVTIASNTLTTLNVTGDTAAKLTANLVGATNTVTGTVTSDAGAHDINITADATDKLSVSLGAGNDQLRVANIAATHTIAGGEGTDTLRYSGADAVTLANTANVTGFESVTLSNVAPASFAMTGAGVTTVTYTEAAAGTFGGLSTGGTVNLNKGGSVTAAAAGVAAGSTAAATTAAATYSGTADSLTVNVGAATTATGAASSTVSAVGVESVTFNSLALPTSTEARTVTFSDTTATTAALKSVTVTSSIPALTTVSVSNAGTSALTTVNLSGVTGGASFTGGATAGTSITGGAGNDALTGGAGPDNISGGEGNDTVNGAAGADTIDAGNGTNNITGGTGADVMTGGAGVDTYVFASNATTASTPVLTSTTSASDTITNFTSGSDKISITGAYAPTKFLGNFTNIQAALSYQAGANGLAYGAAYVTGENTLYVFQKTDGLLHADDMAIKLTNVTALVEGDLFLGAQTTGGASISLTAANAVAGQSGATSGTSVGGVVSTTANLTTADDTVTTTAAFLEGSTLTAGFGNDTLALSITATAANGAGEATLTAAELANVTGFNTLTLANFTNSSTVENVYNITVANANVDDNSTLTVTSSMAGLKSDGTLSTAGVTFDAGNLTSNRKISFSGNSAHDVVTGGAGNDTITGGEGNDTIAGGAGTNSIDGGGGNDTINITNSVASTTAQTIAGGSGVADTLGINVTYDANNATTTSVNLTGSTISGFETILGDGNANRVVLTASQVNATGLTGITGGGGTDVLSLTGLGTSGATTPTFDLTGKTLTTLETITLTSTAGAGETAPSLLVPSAQFTSGTITGTGGALTLTGTTAVTGTSFSGFATVNLSNVLTVASTQFQANASTDLTTITGTASTAGLAIVRAAAAAGTIDLSGAGKAALTGLGTLNLDTFAANGTTAQNNNTLKVDGSDLQGTVSLNVVVDGQGNATGGTGQNLLFASGDVTVSGLTIGSGFDSIQFGASTGTGTQTLTLTNTALPSTVANVLGTNGGSTEALVVNAATATAAINVSTITATTDLASITVNDGTGNNTITTLSGALTAARTAGKVTINLTGGGADTLALNFTTSNDGQNAEVSSNAGVTVNGFTTGIGIGSDKVTLKITDAQTGVTNFQSIGSGTSNTAAALGAYATVVEVGSAIGTVSDFTAVGDGAAVETTLAAAITGGMGATAANIAFIIYGSGASAGKAALYQATIANVATNGNIGTGDISLVNLIGVFNGVDADSFVIGNFI